MSSDLLGFNMSSVELLLEWVSNETKVNLGFGDLVTIY